MSRWLSEGLIFRADWDRYRSDYGILDPEVKDALALVETQRARTVSADRLDMASLKCFVTGFLLGVATLCVWHASFVIGIIVGSLAALAFAASAVTTNISVHRIKAVHETYRAWFDGGDAIRLRELEGFSLDTSLDDATIFRAASLIRDAKIADRRIAWAREALPEGRLATGAHLTFADVDAAAIAMYQDAADLLDPNGEITNAWLRERVSA
ncbi:hypothetical protein [Microbacterium sp. 77mftsu3.1]|uniref:hypothetical protein n=1 Tax=Microbacterium sp. 77mftsu3.1 TaxID=1761802 RepID=UPI0003736273|nr:hypothetical protein [Microbacterium sp. 77mftsu3.1]SDH39323.1 hypothetical protein SAMN04488590_3221 [Microbacterium sp. 77mftsu3.1]